MAKSMKSRNRNRRLAQIAFFGILLIAGTALIFTALRQNLQHFYHPSQVLAADFVPASDTYKIGGIVLPGSIERRDDETVSFAIVDFEEGDLVVDNNPSTIQVVYAGLLPDLFRAEEQAVVTGNMKDGQVFTAVEVMARHDENYEPVKMKGK